MRLLEIARKWQKKAIGQRRRMSLKRNTSDRRDSAVVDGHFVIYTVDGSRYMIPLAFFNRPIFRELLLMAEEEFGFIGRHPLTVPCDSFVEYIVYLLNKHASKEVEKALVSMACCRASHPSLALQAFSEPMILHSF
ncbi:auxin-responsive protein SAUR68-like [Amborella trichopoda]|uniref:auxin-responsive protein SAUR68-like n=1 Tax=Amborella trichopoda TaxID=13333 RepID=UPI0005D403C9|nr:auxin-responsive protein SAUR68-like [Amborella trichopoda]|eukprot:XP_011626701.1 auxin-responsive protein SAUR68-like [Amborella trichopoda]